MKPSSQNGTEVEAVAALVRQKYDADIVLYFGPVDRPKDDVLIRECAKKKKRRKNVLLMICTYGGDPHAAYRMARVLQNTYAAKGGEVIAYVFSACWSAGTLMIMGANRLILSVHAELGPVDVQLRKAEEVGERTSGLTPIQAMGYLCEESKQMFYLHFHNLRFHRNLPFSTKLASTVAAELTTGLLGKLYEQIDPMRVAEVNRSLGITTAYGQRIEKNLKPGALDKLLMDYPSHNFVIDPLEARELFERVDEPSAELEKLGELLKDLADKLLSSSAAQVCYLEEPEPPVSAPKPPQPTPPQPDSSNENDDELHANGAAPASSAPVAAPVAAQEARN